MQIDRLLSGLAMSVFVIASPALADTPVLVEDGTLSICTDATFPPMEFMAAASDSEPSGFDMDLARALASEWGAESEIVVMDFAGLLPSLEAGRCDIVVSGILLTEERLQKFDGVPYFSTAGILFGKADAPAIADIAELSGQTIAVQTGTAYVDRVAEINAELEGRGLAPAEVQLYPKATDVAQQVLVGRAFAGTSQDTELAFREIENPGEFGLVWTFESSDLYAIYLRKDDGDAEAVAATLAAMHADGRLADLGAQWKLAPEKFDAAFE